MRARHEGRGARGKGRGARGEGRGARGEGRGARGEWRGARGEAVGVVELLTDRFWGNFSSLRHGQLRLQDGRGETVTGVAV